MAIPTAQVNQVTLRKASQFLANAAFGQVKERGELRNAKTNRAILNSGEAQNFSSKISDGIHGFNSKPTAVTAIGRGDATAVRSGCRVTPLTRESDEKPKADPIGAKEIPVQEVNSRCDSLSKRHFRSGPR